MKRPLIEIPTVDFNLLWEKDKCDNEQVYQARELFGAALEDNVGIVFIKNSGVEQHAISEAYKAYEKFFILPRFIKEKYMRENIDFQRGWTPPQQERAIGTAVRDHKENLFFGPENPPKELMWKYPKLYHENIWPDEVPEMKKCTTDLYRSLLACGWLLLEVLHTYLGVKEKHFHTISYNAPHVLRSLYYPAVSAHEAPNVLWGGEHVDMNLLTILLPATTSGLMAKKKGSEEWVSVAIPKNCLAVQVADQLQFLTGGKFLSARHKVVPPSAGSPARISAAFFLHSHPETVLEPLPPFREACAGNKDYAPIRASEFVQKKLYETLQTSR